MRELLDLSPAELEAYFASIGEPRYRARQVFEWAWKHLVRDFSAMTNLPVPLRERLSREFAIGAASPGATVMDAEEGTEKVLLVLADGEAIETVLMRDADRRTVCVSTQVGCPVGCAFCATGRMGFRRDLTSGEIALQVLFFARRLKGEGERVTHVVLMGMGEPLLNYEATLKAIRNLNHPWGLNIGARRFTVSTVGIVPGILRLAREGIQLNLAISLHAPWDGLRAELVPATKRYPIADVLAAAEQYTRATKRRVTYEYVLIDGVNDSPAAARALARLLAGRLAHVNLIPFNPAPGLPFRRPPLSRVEAFKRALLARGIDVTVRYSRGVRIQAGCGQLRAARLGATPR
ncbi:MAG: 23S rRNA (adenine(2503)-C(2))-methyltransferase RlmN [Caldiserica bacterium]|nr:23S rRNA (adenine(2503)-C(2))-methyltransferase RlmN [Caldisericota bacterium]